MADFLNGKIGLRNIHVLGPVSATRASVGIEYEYDPDSEMFVPVEVDGWTNCLTEVAPWPFDADAAGIGYPAGTIGVRTRTWRRPMADGGGDSEDYWTAVPDSLPDGYTEVTRGQGILIDGFYADYLGSDPFSGTTWNLRTATGTVLTIDNDPLGLRAKWTPMNQGQQVLPITIGDIYTGQWVDYRPDASSPFEDTLYFVAALATNHIGFRGGKLVFTVVRNGSPPMVYSQSATYEIVAVRADRYWDRWDADGTEDVVEVLTSGSISFSFSTYEDPPVVIEHVLDELIPEEIGIPFNFFIRYPYNTDPSGGVPIFTSSHAFQLSPRVDVPLWYSASMGNYVAPGGYIASVSPP